MPGRERRVVRVSAHTTSSSTTGREVVRVVKGGHKVRRVSHHSVSHDRVVVHEKRAHHRAHRVVKESTSTSTEVVEKHLPKKKRVKNVVVE